MAVRNIFSAGTGIDALSYALTPIGVPLQVASYGLTGQSLGKNLTGRSAVSDVTDLAIDPLSKAMGIFKGKTSADGLQRSQKDAAVQQLQRAGEIEAELEAMGRPEMDAQVQRQQEVAGLAERYAREGMPEAQRQAAADDIARNQQAQLSALSGLGAGLRGASNTQASTAQAYRNLAAQDAAMAQQNQGQYLQSLGALGQAEGAAEYYNELLPYQEKQQELQALLGAGMQNQMGAQQFGYQNAMANRQTGVDLFGTGLQLLGGVI